MILYDCSHLRQLYSLTIEDNIILISLRGNTIYNLKLFFHIQEQGRATILVRGPYCAFLGALRA
jgi:hypothetical protein